MRTVIVDFRIADEERQSLLNLGYEILLCPPNSILHTSVCGHPDMLLHFINKDTLLFHKDMDENFISALRSLNFKILLSKNSLESLYPNNIALNALNLEEYFLHRMDFTDPVLLEEVKNKKILNVRQGYTKCSCAIVNDHAIITSDRSIIKALQNEKIEILYVPPGDILLPGLAYGFIGGTCGLLDSSTLAFYGDLNQYAYGKEILDFLKIQRVTPVFLGKGKLVDRGSIFSLDKTSEKK